MDVGAAPVGTGVGVAVAGTGVETGVAERSRLPVHRRATTPLLGWAGSESARRFTSSAVPADLGVHSR